MQTTSSARQTPSTAWISTFNW